MLSISTNTFLFYDLSDAHLKALKENWRLSPPVREGCMSSSCLTPTLPVACVCYSSPYLSPYVSVGCMVRQQIASDCPQISKNSHPVSLLCHLFSCCTFLKKVQDQPIFFPPSAGGQMQTHAAHLKSCCKKYTSTQHIILLYYYANIASLWCAHELCT